MPRVVPTPDPTPADLASRIALVRAQKQGLRRAGSVDFGDGGEPADRPARGRGKDWSPGCRRMPDGRCWRKAIEED